MMFGDYGHWGAWGWVGMALGMVVFWGLLFAAIYWLVRSVSRPEQPRGPAGDRPNPEQLLAARFARGEIDEVEYRNRLATLHGKVLS